MQYKEFEYKGWVFYLGEYNEEKQGYRLDAQTPEGYFSEYDYVAADAIATEEKFIEFCKNFYEDTLAGTPVYFKDVTDCDNCPFRQGGDYEKFCSSHPDAYHPCEDSDKYREMHVDDVIRQFEAQERAYEDYMERQWEKEEAKEKKKKETQEKRAKTKMENYSLDRELTRLRRSIRKRKEALSFMRSFASAVAFTNQMMNNEELKKPELPKHPFDLEIEKMEQRIEEINAEKKRRAKARREKK